MTDPVSAENIAATTNATVPVGTIIASACNANSRPANWLPCDGSPIPKQYAQLGTILGTGTTPNLIGRTLIGAGSFAAANTGQTDTLHPQFPTTTPETRGLNVGDTGGEWSHKLNVAELPSHVHPIYNNNFGVHHRSFKGNDGKTQPFEANPDGTLLQTTDAMGGDAAHFNVQPYYAVTYLIYAGTN